jgi:hypothetical protein
MRNSWLSSFPLPFSPLILSFDLQANVRVVKSVHYAYGNIDFAQKSWDGAKRAYEASLKICLASFPIHPITAAAYYSLGCVEEKRRNLDNAKYVPDNVVHTPPFTSLFCSLSRIVW